MRFDDRLNIVLGQEPADGHERAVRWRQLVELLVRADEASAPLVRQALITVKSEAPDIDPQLRAATARAIARPRLSLDLVELFAADVVEVSGPVLSALKLSAEEWARVRERASLETRQFLGALHPALEGAQAAATAEAASPEPFESKSETDCVAKPVAAIPSISDVLARIERLRQERQALRAAAPDPGDEPRGGASPATFRWECGPSGEIAWVEGIPRGALIGRSLAVAAESGDADERIRHAFAVRAPFRDASLAIAGEGAAAGEWKLSGLPAFERADGRFAGYRGIGTRAGTDRGAAGADSALSLDPDSLRELVHELRTPLNAIIGFAEMIEGQYLGPAGLGYRERAADIAAQARLLLSAIEDLDLAAQLSSPREPAAGSTDLRELIVHSSSELVERAARRGASLHLDLPAHPVLGEVEKSLASRMVRRFCGSIIDAAGEGERLSLVLVAEPEQCLLSLGRPELLSSASSIRSSPAARLTTDLSLRLISALARVVGGDVVETDESLTLCFRRRSDLRGKRARRYRCRRRRACSSTVEPAAHNG